MNYYRRMDRRCFALRALLPAIVTALIAGCLDTSTAVTLRDDGSGSIELAYRIDAAAWDTGVFDDSDVARPVPVTKREFAQAALRIEGLRLDSHRTTREDDRVHVVARLRFDSVDALARLLGPGSLTVEQNEDGGHWRQVVAEGEGATGDSVERLAEELSSYTLTFTLETPSDIASTNGEKTGSSTARFTVDLGTVARASEPIVWDVRW